MEKLLTIPLTIFSAFISGFMAVWAFRYITKSEKSAGFEYFGLSAFWGLVLTAILNIIVPNGTIFDNPFANVLFLPILSTLSGILVGGFSLIKIKK